MARRSRNHPPELRECAVQMVGEVLLEYPSEWPAICAVVAKLGIGSVAGLRTWVRQVEVDAPDCPRRGGFGRERLTLA